MMHCTHFFPPYPGRIIRHPLLTTFWRKQIYQCNSNVMKRIYYSIPFDMYLSVSVLAFQQRTITGKVTDAKDGSPIPGGA